MNDAPWWLGLGFCGTGGPMLLIGLLWGLKLSRFLAKASRTTGVVTGVVPRTSTDDSGMTSTTYAPAVRFQSPAGQQIDFVSAISGSSVPQVGAPIDVLYLPDNPQNAKVGSGWLWLGPLLFGFIGGIFGAVGVFLHFNAPG